MILVTGGTGLVGCHLLYLLIKNDKKVSAIHRKNSNLEKVKKVFSTYSENSEELFEKINWIEGDINDLESLSFAFKNIQTLYNPIEHYNAKLPLTEENSLNYEYVLFYGRLVDEVKNLKLLINAYHKSILSEREIKLLIVGDGKDKDMLKEMVQRLGLSEMILFKPFMPNPFPIVKGAKYTLLTSNHEGFPMTILESLACGTPVVSVDCKSGPNEIIRNTFNGLLVSNNNIEELVNAMNSFILNSELYNNCKLNTKVSISQFTIDVIAKQWCNLLR